MAHPVYYVEAGDTLPIFFDTFDGGTGASITMTGLAVTDIEIYKDGSVTQRSSDAGYTLLDTDGIDFDGVTGIHGFSLDLSDNTDTGFYAVGSWYHVVVSSVTVDGQTVNFIAAAFRIVSATRGMAGTALPDAAADAAGGIPVSDAGGLDLDTLNTNVSSILTDTAEIGTAGAGLTNINLPNQTMDIVGSITGNLSGSVGSVTGAINTAAGTITTLDALDTAQDSQHSTTQGKVDTAQADLDILTGTDGATLATSQANYAPATAASLATAQTDLDTITGSDGVTLATSQGNYAPATAAALATAQSDLDTLTGSDGATLATAQPNVGNIPGTAQTGTLSTTVMTTDLTGYADDELIGRVVIWTGGDADGQASDITDYASTNGTVTYTAITTAPANGDTFVIV